MKTCELTIKKYAVVKDKKKLKHPLMEHEITSLALFKDKTFNILDQLSRKYPYCDDFKFVVKEDINQTYNQQFWYEIVATVAVKTDISLNTVEIKDEVPPRIIPLDKIDLQTLNRQITNLLAIKQICNAKLKSGELSKSDEIHDLEIKIDVFKKQRDLLIQKENHYKKTGQRR